MSFWDTTVATAKDVLDVAVQKTEKTVEVQKKRFAVQKQKNKVEKAFQTLGKCYYDGQRGDDSSNELLNVLCNELDEELRILKQLKTELADLKNQE